MTDDDVADRRVLAAVLGINLAQAAAGFVVGVWASSTAVLGTGLDNLGDAGVYALGLFAVGRAARIKAVVARVSAALLVLFSAGLVVEVVRRFVLGADPFGPAMMITASVNVVLAVVCLRLLAAHRGQGAHFSAARIFSANDVLANLGTIASGALVYFIASPTPDLVIGLVVAAIAMHSAKEILERARESTAAPKTSPSSEKTAAT